MKHKIFLMAIVAVLLGAFCSCSTKESETLNRPVLYVVNGSNYSVEVYCDNHLVATARAHNNSGGIRLSNVSINIPVYVEVYYYDSKGKYQGNLSFDNYYFKWNSSYKLTINGTHGTLQQI
jgi:uncharacterized protein YcfL